MTRFSFDEMTNGPTGRTHWSLADAYVKSYSHVSPTPLLDGAYCNALLLINWSVRQKLNHVSSVQFSYISPYTP